MNTKVNLVQTVTQDELILSGLFAEGDKSKEAIIFIHGFGTDFFTHNFTHVIADSLTANSNAFVLGQTRGSSLRNELILKSRTDGVERGVPITKR